MGRGGQTTYGRDTGTTSEEVVVAILKVSLGFAFIYLFFILGKNGKGGGAWREGRL